MKEHTRQYPLWVKIATSPFVAVLYFLKILWLIATAIMALAGTVAGQPVRLVMIFVYYIFFFALQGWNEGRDMILRGHKISSQAKQDQGQGGD